MEPQRTTRRVTLVAGELLGYFRTGGLGTATAFLAVALARAGHDVEVLYTGDPPAAPMDAEWARLYEEAGVRLRLLPRDGRRVSPPSFVLPRAVELALAADPPDVVVAQDLAAPAYSALRLRRLGLAFERTLFVVYCHGTRQWITDVSRKVRVLPGAHAVTALERASLELADVVVSPSAYLVGWMRRQGWRLPKATHVVPYLTRSAATGGQPPRAPDPDGRVDRIAFFGRLEERKGVRPFAEALNALEPELLGGVALTFVGRATPAWPPERLESLLSERTRRALRGLEFHTDLDQPDALAELSRPGTVAVMPSLEDNSPNALYECLERRIPFLASSAGGGAELVAPEDREAALFEPTAAGIQAALRRALRDGPRVPRSAFDPTDAVRRWAEVVATEPTDPRRSAGETEEWTLWPHDEPVPPGVRETMLRAQAASGADVVTCGVRVDDSDHLFAGDPGGLGALSNAYGTVALVRRERLDHTGPPPPDAHDPSWPRLARLAAAGARVVSIPRPLVEQPEPPGDLLRDPQGALAVAEELERALPPWARGLARLAAGLAAEAQSPPRTQATAGVAPRVRAAARRVLARR